MVPWVRANLDGAHLHGIIAIDYVGVSAIGPAVHGAGGRGNGVLAFLQQQVSIDELVRPQRVVCVVERRLQLHRSGRLIDLVVDGEQRARSQLRLVIAAVGIDLQRALLHTLRHFLQLVFWNGKDQRYRLELGDDDHGGAAGRSNVIAGINQAQSNSARAQAT